MPISTVGAAHSMLTRSWLIVANIRAGSTLRRHTCVPPTAVTVHTNVQPLAWNIGMSAHDPRTAVIDDVCKVVGCDVGDAITLADAVAL